MNQVLTRIREDKKEFITSETLRNYCEELYYNYRLVENYLISRGFLVNILDDVYYVKNVDEINKNMLKYSILEIVAKALMHKGVKNWYYGLYTALELINNDYKSQEEYIYLINDRFLKRKSIKILGKEFRFLRFKNAFFNFGIIDGKVRYSDLEKTILDLIYLMNYNHINENRMLIELSKLLDGIIKDKILKYSQFYPKSNKSILKKVLNKVN
ncbi:MAG: hypothetical protein ACFFDY_08090 [Candidatus Thorarchaeota archaeon]